MSTPKRDKFISLKEIIIIASLLIFSAAGLLYIRSTSSVSGNIAVISLGGEEIMRIDLGKYKDKTELISLKEEYDVPVNFEVKDGGIRFYDVTCPDKLCEKYGVISNEYESAICLPNQTVLRVYAPDDIPK